MERLSITELVNKIYNDAEKKGLYNDMHLLERLKFNQTINNEEFQNMMSVCINAKLKHISNEVAECSEALRNPFDNDFDEELADIVILCFSLAGYLNIELEHEIYRKVAINEQRPYLHKEIK